MILSAILQIVEASLIRYGVDPLTHLPFQCGVFIRYDFINVIYLLHTNMTILHLIQHIIYFMVGEIHIKL